MIAVKRARRKRYGRVAAKGARSSGILSSRSRTPLPKLMQSCQSFYAICNRISLRRRTGAPFCLGVKSSFSISPLLFPSAEPPPVANRFDVPSIKDLSLFLSPSLLLLRLFVRSVSFYPSKFPFRFLIWSLASPLSLSASRRKVSRDFLSPSSPHSRRFSTLDTSRFRRVSIQRARSFL